MANEKRKKDMKVSLGSHSCWLPIRISKGICRIHAGAVGLEDSNVHL